MNGPVSFGFRRGRFRVGGACFRRVPPGVAIRLFRDLLVVPRLKSWESIPESDLFTGVSFMMRHMTARRFPSLEAAFESSEDESRWWLDDMTFYPEGEDPIRIRYSLWAILVPGEVRIAALIGGERLSLAFPEDLPGLGPWAEEWYFLGDLMSRYPGAAVLASEGRIGRARLAWRLKNL